PLSDAVETMIRARDGDVTWEDADKELDRLGEVDFRQQALKYLYRTRVDEQVNLNVQGGAESYRYFLSGGFDRNKLSVIGDDYSRITLNSANTYKLSNRVELLADISFARSQSNNNGIGWSDLSSNIFPYTQLVGLQGKILPI